MVLKPLVLDQDETDMSQVMSKLYRFSRDLKYTLSNRPWRTIWIIRS